MAGREGRVPIRVSAGLLSAYDCSSPHLAHCTLCTSLHIIAHCTNCCTLYVVHCTLYDCSPPQPCTLCTSNWTQHYWRVYDCTCTCTPPHTPMPYTSKVQVRFWGSLWIATPEVFEMVKVLFFFYFMILVIFVIKESAIVVGTSIANTR